MKVELLNYGPFTILLYSDHLLEVIGIRSDD